MIACNSFEILVSGSVPQTRSLKLGHREKFTLHTDFAYRREGLGLARIANRLASFVWPPFLKAVQLLVRFHAYDSILLGNQVIRQDLSADSIPTPASA